MKAKLTVIHFLAASECSCKLSKSWTPHNNTDNVEFLLSTGIVVTLAIGTLLLDLYKWVLIV